MSVGYPLFPVSPDAAGGAEQILYLLDREYSVHHHCRSIVVAPEGSAVQGQLMPTLCVGGEITDDLRNTAATVHARVIRDALTRYPVDLIHFHGLDFLTYLPETTVPMLATLHLPIPWYPPSLLSEIRFAMNCVSHAQAAGTGLPVVLNGVDTDRFVPTSSKNNHFLWLGRVCPEKGVHLALQAAKEAGVSLQIAGPVHPFSFHQEYFRREVLPLLDDKRRYVGPVGGRTKSRLLAEARGLLVTSLAAETSSLVAMEAASSGTPVIALRSGALPEVVEHGHTGFVADAPDQLADYLRRADEISPENCRQTAVKRFSAQCMGADYLALYKRILGIGCAPQDCLYAS